VPPVELGLASSARHLPNRSALSCEAVPINRDCRGIESYGRSSFLLLSTESSSRTPPRVYYCYYHYCFPHVYSFPFFGIFLRPMRERTADGIVPPRPLPISRSPSFARTRILLFFDRIWISRYKLSPCSVGATTSLPVYAYSESFGENEFHFLR